MEPDPASASAMRAFWDEKARENAMWFIHSQLDFANPDEAEFWRSGAANLDATLEPFGRRIQPTDLVVEIGCGIGRITRALAQRASSVVGVDVSAEMIERGRQALADVPNAELMLGSGSDLTGLPDAAFDVAYSFIVFQHIPDPAITCSYIRDIGRVLKPGGWTVFQISERPEIHSADHWGRDGLRTRLRRRLGRAPKGCSDLEWLGAAVDRKDLLAALADGGLVLDKTVGDGTQFCFVAARRPG